MMSVSTCGVIGDLDAGYVDIARKVLCYACLEGGEVVGWLDLELELAIAATESEYHGLMV